MSIGRTLCAALAVVMLAVLPAKGQDTPEQLYEAAIATMATLPEPPFIAYALEGQSDYIDGNPLELDLLTDGGFVWFQMRPGIAESRWTVLHRSRDFENSIVDDDQRQFFSNRSFFDPTWDGAFHALHDGMYFLGYYSKRWQPPPKSVATPLPEPTGAPPSDLRTIALLRVMGPQVYIVSDGGAVMCDNGDPGHSLHLKARSDPEAHQLTEAVVDVPLKRFCMVRFSEPDRMAASVEQHYATVRGYWMETGGIVTARFLRGFRLRDFTWRYRLTGMTFPPSIPDTAFVSAFR
jgi:hypothetical protein